MNRAAARRVDGTIALRAMAGLGLSVAIVGCSPGSNDDELAGSVSAVASEADGQPGRWIITIELDGGTVAGSSDVQVAFDSTDLVCDDGSGVVVPSSLSVGDRLTVVRDGEEVETADPPIVAGDRVVVLCSQ